MNYHFYHLRRSGSHAVVEWVMRHFDGSSGLTNNMKSSPVRKFHTTHMMVDGSFVDRDTKRDVVAEDAGEYRWKKDRTFLTYEDWEDPYEIWAESLTKNQQWILGFGDHFWFGCIRSFRNNAASRVKISRTRGQNMTHGFTLRFVEDWKRLATLALSRPQIIRYDLMVTDTLYRDEIRDELGLDFVNAQRADEGLRIQAHVPYGGRGSTFDGRVPDARQLEVTTRWRQMQHDPWMRDYVLNDKEALELDDALFRQA